MAEKTNRILSDSKSARWTALFIVSFTMLCGYFMADVVSPLQNMLESSKNWDSVDFGLFNSAYGWLNVFLFMLIFGGMILDKMGARFTGILASLIMIIGTSLSYYALSTHTLDHVTILGWKGTVMVASAGYAIFGVGIETIGITATKIIVKWFRGREMALGMGIQVATARIGTILALVLPIPVAHLFISVSAPLLVCLIMLITGFIAFFIFTFMDKKLDKSIKDSNQEPADEESFRFRDILLIIKNKGFWYVAILCVLFYSAVFPFIKYATGLMIQKFGVNETWAGSIPAMLPFGTMLMTPFFGSLYDRKGKGATIMIIGAILIICVHTVLSIPFLNFWIVAILMMVVLGVGFSLVPSAMWPSVPKIIPEKQLGTAYAVIFWLQNLGALMGVPLLIGWVLNKYCFIGYFAIMGTGFTTTQGDHINMAITKSHYVYSLSKPGEINRDEKAFHIKKFEKDPSGNIVNIITEKGEKINREFITDKSLKKAIKKMEVKIPIYSIGDKGEIDHFVTNKGKSVSNLSYISTFYNYTIPMIIFACCGVLALLFAFLLKAEDRKKGYGLELPNIKK